MVNLMQAPAWQPPLPQEVPKAPEPPKPEPQQQVMSEYERFMAEVRVHGFSGFMKVSVCRSVMLASELKSNEACSQVFTAHTCLCACMLSHQCCLCVRALLRRADRMLRA